MISTTNTTYEIVDRNINVPMTTSTFAVNGDNDSRVLIFQITRYVDGADLTKKEIYICYKTSSATSGDTLATNMKSTNTVLKFDWIVPSQVTTSSGLISYYVEFRELDKDKNKIYVLRTKTITQKVEDSFNVNNTATAGNYTTEDLFLKANTSHLTRKDLVDNDIPFKVTDRNININPKKTIAVLKDNMSQILSFRLKRTVDGVDRADKTFCFKFINAKGESDFCIASNVTIFADEIIIGWALDSKVTKQAGTVTFAICVLGKLSDGTFYSWNTLSSQITVENGLDVTSSMVVPDQSWFNDWAVEADNVLKQAAQYANTSKDNSSNIDIIKKELVSLSSNITEQVKLAKTYADAAANTTAKINGLYAVRSDKDATDKKTFKTVKYFRSDNSLFMTSILTTINTTYDQRTETEYDLDGTTVLTSKVYPIVRDIDGMITGQFGNMNQLQYHGLL
jgi:hypothetical protein